VIGGELEDIGNFFKGVGEAIRDEAVSYWDNPLKIALRVVSVMGWPAYLASFLPQAFQFVAERVIEAAPTLLTDPDAGFFESWAAEYVWRQRMYATYRMIDQGLAYAKTVEAYARNPEAAKRLVDKVDFDRLIEEGKAHGSQHGRGQMFSGDRLPLQRGRRRDRAQRRPRPARLQPERFQHPYREAPQRSQRCIERAPLRDARAGSYPQETEAPDRSPSGSLRRCDLRGDEAS